MSFRRGKKIFATLDEKEQIAVVKLSSIHQSVFCAINKTIIYPVAGAWGKHGWTKIELSTVNKKLLMEMLTFAYCLVAPAAAAEKYKKGSKSQK